MKTLSRQLLRIVTGFVPVVIAACYGAPYGDKELRGKTVDAESGAAIAGLSVRCDHDTDNVDSDISKADGTFELAYPPNYPCSTIVAEDVDGAANGSYATTTVPFDGTAASTTIALQKK